MKINPCFSLIKPEIEARIQHLLAQMTLEEKIGQTNQINTFQGDQRLAVQQGKIGSFLNASSALTGQGQSASASAEMCNLIQKAAVEESRLHIPLLFGRDVIHGYRTVFPIPLGQAASWNPELVEQAAEVSAMEASADGIKWTFAPMIDVTRDPRWGRVAEGQGEDPYLSARLATAMVRGFQGTDFSQPRRVVACAKHFVGYGASEGGRDYEGAEISMRTLRDVYLPPYKAAVEAGVGTVMAAFLDLNGIPMTCNSPLINGVLRKEFGFEGFVVSDWAAVAELVNHGVAADRAEAAALALRGGVDMDMVAQVYSENLADCLNQGAVSLDELDQAVLRILRIKALAGLFDNPYTDLSRAQAEILTPTARQKARQLAHQSMVLLKNSDGLLPLQHKYIAVVGPLVHAQETLFGTWTPDGRREEVTPLSEALQAVAPADTWLRFGESADEAVRLAGEADVVVLVVGEQPSRSGENSNVSDLGLPPGQSELVRAAAAQGKPVVLVVIAGRPLAIPLEAALAQAVLYVFHPGTEGGAALGEILFGAVSPSARLPISIPRATGQVPIYYNHKNSGRPAGIGQFQTRYVDSTHLPLFPFGYGLTYTSFDYAKMHLSSSEMTNSLNVSAVITNTGCLPGEEVVQLYIRDLVGSVTRPVKQLKGFQRLALQPGESKTVQFTLTAEDLMFAGPDESPILEPGEYHVWIAPNSVQGLQKTFTLK